MVTTVGEREFINPCVFLVGCPRSGTTLLQRMFDAHPQLTVANDTHFITRAVEGVLQKNSNPALTAELVDQVWSYRRFYRMGLDQQEVHEAARHCGSYNEFVSRLYDRRAQQRGKTISGEKTPDYCKQIPLLNQLFPRAKFIHIIRDGRDTALSALDWATQQKGPGKWSLWETDAVGTCALWWQLQVSSGCLDGARLGPALYHQLRYEDLLADPAAVLREAVSFLGIPYAEQMIRFFEGKTKLKEGLSAKSAWLPPTRGLRSWRSQMSADDVAVFDGIAGNWLDKTGYEHGNYLESQAVKGRIESCLAWWETEGKSKGVKQEQQQSQIC